MAEHIERDKLLYEFREIMPDIGVNELADKLYNVALDLPAADVAEVKHGKWENIPLNMDPNYFAYKFNLRKKCSICGYAMPKEWPNFNICPNCGAKMTED